MGYACPVCETPQADGEHLANHLAFTAMLHGEDHAAWLDAHVSDWADRSPEELAPLVSEQAEETAYDAVFEDSTDREGGQAERSDDGHCAHPHGDGDHGGSPFDGIVDEEVARVIEEARELTRSARERDADEE